jgi:hypothetical protein
MDCVDKYNSLVTQYCQQTDYMDVYIKTKQLEIDTLQQENNAKQLEIDSLKEESKSKQRIIQALETKSNQRIDALIKKNKHKRIKMRMRI